MKKHFDTNVLICIYYSHNLKKNYRTVKLSEELIHNSTQVWVNFETFIFFLIKICNRYGVGNNVRKYQSIRVNGFRIMSQCPKYIVLLSVYFGPAVPDYLTFLDLLFLKTEILQERDIYFNKILFHFDLTIFFLGWIIKMLQKGELGGAQSIFFKKSVLHICIAVLTDIIAILLTPGNFSPV